MLNTSSIECLGANFGHAAYSASKAGLHGLTRSVTVDQ
ncbi:SDR family NAD(P)-dependent oxidoreductase [Bacillus salinus]|nr:SDR family NAD(P)-dependent oxidoreductase [Bacillus sp. HMF5848]